MDAHDKHIFIVGAIEDADIAIFGDRFVNAPEKVMREVFLRWLFEGRDVATLGVYSRHDVSNRAVLARGIERLQDDEQGALLLGVKEILQLFEIIEIFYKSRFHIVALITEQGLTGIVVRKFDLLARRYDKFFAEIRRHADPFVQR